MKSHWSVFLVGIAAASHWSVLVGITAAGVGLCMYSDRNVVVDLMARPHGSHFRTHSFLRTTWNFILASSCGNR